MEKVSPSVGTVISNGAGRVAAELGIVITVPVERNIEFATFNIGKKRSGVPHHTAQVAAFHGFRITIKVAFSVSPETKSR